MAVHVWSKDGEYLGQIAGRDDLFDVSDPGNKELMRATDVLLGRPPISDSGGIDVRFGDQRRYLEFPSEDWLGVAAIVYLPPAGFRVHVISGPPRELRALGKQPQSDSAITAVPTEPKREVHPVALIRLERTSLCRREGEV